MEAGAWRVEMSPATQHEHDEFLVVLIPHSASGNEQRHHVRLIEDDSRIGCEIESHHRTTRFWFDSNHYGTLVEVLSDIGRHREHDIRIRYPFSKPDFE